MQVSTRRTFNSERRFVQRVTQGKDDEWSREYKLYTDKGAAKESDSNKNILKTVKELDDEAKKKEALEDMTAASRSVSGGGEPIIKVEGQPPEAVVETLGPMSDGLILRFRNKYIHPRKHH